ncbi:histidine kinase [Gammaproteobacteria bacterium 45_16_T64]|nr:histidine kinase [Gammaproteobacteria bacterium 45_16_T64]
MKVYNQMNQDISSRDVLEDPREKLIRSARLHFVHWIVIALSILLTVGAWYFSKQQLDQKLEAKFHREAEQVVELIKERMALYENALWGGVALIDSNQGEISYTQWLAYSNSLNIDKSYPGINGFGVIFNIRPSKMEAYLTKEREIRPDYKLHPIHKESEFWPITYVEPADSNKKAIGLDMAFETNRYTGIKKSRDTGTAQLTGPIILVQDAKKTPGFLFYTPFYEQGNKPITLESRRKNIVGVTYAPFIMYKLMQGALSTQSRHVGITIKDQGELLYSDDNESLADYDKNPLYRKSVSVDLYGRTWAFDIQSDLKFRAASASSQPSWILLGGVIIDSLLIGLFLFLRSANRKALVYADQITEKLENKTRRLEKSNQDLEQFSYVASHDLKSPLNGIKQLASWIEEDCQDILPLESKKHLGLLRSRSQRMIKLLNDLLEYSRINRQEYTPELVDLRAMVNDITELLDFPDSFNVSTTDIQPRIQRAPLEIVLRNLISNAIKHHDKDSGEIVVNYTDMVTMHVISVMDDGPGIPEEYHSKALEMFNTLQPRDEVEGSGMGLAIVKRIIEHHGGKLEIENRFPRGSSFILSWPVVQQGAQQGVL